MEKLNLSFSDRSFVKDDVNTTKIKRLIILALYVNIGNSSAQRVRSMLEEVNNSVNQTFVEDGKKMGYLIRILTLPVKDGQETKVECIFDSDSTNNSNNSNALGNSLELNVKDILRAT